MPDATVTPPARPPAPTDGVPRPTDLFAPEPRGADPIDASEPELPHFEHWNELREPLKALGRRACIAVAVRVAKRVDVLVRLRNAAVEAAAAGLDVPHWVWYGRTAGAAEVAASEIVLAPTAARAASCAVAACAAAAGATDGPPGEFRQLVSRDVSRIRTIAALERTGGLPLTGWDDLRFGPVWPAGPPEWHRKAERVLGELKDKLADRTTPVAAPIGEEKLAQIKDANFLSALHRRGELDRFVGCHVIAYREQIVGHGRDLAAVRADVAARIGVPEARLAATFVPAF
jgi:hypothetical protein